MKTIDEIFDRKRLLIDDGVEWIPLNQARAGAEEYADQFKQSQPTDEDIRKWIFENNPVDDKYSEWDYGFRHGIMFGAKALRDNKIPTK